MSAAAFAAALGSTAPVGAGPSRPLPGRSGRASSGLSVRPGGQCRNGLGPLGACVGFHPAGAEGPQTATEAWGSLPRPKGDWVSPDQMPRPSPNPVQAPSLDPS